MHCLVFTDTDLYSLTKGKSYLAKQKWRPSTCIRDQCYDVGCHPCYKIIHFSMQFSAIVNRFMVKTYLNSAFTNDLKRKYFFSKNVHSCRLSLFNGLFPIHATEISSTVDA